MRREEFRLFSSLFGSRGRSVKREMSESPELEVVVTASAQPHVLREKMKEKKVTHGETVTATLSPVRLETAYGKMVLQFCPLKSIEISKIVQTGDGGRLPDEVAVEGLKVPSTYGSGMYTLRNVKLTSNGVVQVSATPKTEWEMVLEKSF